MKAVLIFEVSRNIDHTELSLALEHHDSPAQQTLNDIYEKYTAQAVPGDHSSFRLHSLLP
jgi:hypothetical protein